MAKLIQPKNVRKVEVRNCANCALRETDEDSVMFCRRDEEYTPWGDEMEMHYTVCDGYQATKKSSMKTHMERIVEEEDVYQQQFLEKPRKKQWADIMEFDSSRVVKSEEQVLDNSYFSVESILAELEAAHAQHGKPLRLVRIKRTTITEVEIIKEYIKCK